MWFLVSDRQQSCWGGVPIVAECYYWILTKVAASQSMNPMVATMWFVHSHRIHGTGIFTYIWLILMVNVGKYTIDASWILWDFENFGVQKIHLKVSNHPLAVLKISQHPQCWNKLYKSSCRFCMFLLLGGSKLKSHLPTTSWSTAIFTRIKTGKKQLNPAITFTRKKRWRGSSCNFARGEITHPYP